MAEPSGTELIIDWFGLKTDVVDVSDWTVEQQSCSFISRRNTKLWQNRSDIVQAIIHHRSTHHLRTILGTEWDVDEVLSMPDHAKNTHSVPRLYYKMAERTALQQAARQGWIEGAKMLLDAGAKCLKSKALETELCLALQNQECPVEMIELLLKHGANPNYHDNFLVNIPLYQSIYGLMYDTESYTRIAELLLVHGADPNEPSRSKCMIHSCPLHAVLKLFTQLMHRICDLKDLTNLEQRMSEFKKANAVLFKTLVKYGADVNWNEGNMPPLLHKMVGQHFHRDSTAFPRCLFLPEQLDLFFQHGGDINMVDAEHFTALEYAASEVCTQTNSLRWLIRHGTDTTPLWLSMLRGCIFPLVRIRQPYQSVETPLFLLNAGMNVSQATCACLINMEQTIVHDDSQAALDQAESFWYQLIKAEFLTNKDYSRKRNFREYLTRQMVDLQEFSDVSLHIYPKEVVRAPGNNRQYVLDQIHTVLDFLSQPQTLQWHCRRLLRENLKSLQPSVVKTLNIPVGLKRYILCHEI